MNTTYTAIYDRKAVRRGDSVDGLKVTITNQETGEPVIPDKVCVQLRNSLDKEVYTFETEVNPVTGELFVGPIPAETTKTFSVGKYKYDVQYSFISGRVRTYLSGTIHILEDVSRCPAS